MKKLSSILAVFILTFTTAFSQSPDTLWTKTYGGTGADECFDIQLTDDGGYKNI